MHASGLTDDAVDRQEANERPADEPSQIPVSKLTQFCRELGLMTARSSDLDDLVAQILEAARSHFRLEGLWLRLLDSDDRLVAEAGHVEFLGDGTPGYPLDIEGDLHGRMGSSSAASALLEELACAVAWSVGEFESELARRALEQTYAYVMDSTQEAVVALDLQGLIVAFNPAAENLFEVSSDDAIGTPVSRFWPPELRAEQEALLESVRRTGGVSGYETYRLTSSGQRVPLELSVSLRFDSRGRQIGYSGMLRDISERQHVEKILNEIHGCVAKVVGDDFFRELVAQLGQLLGLRYALVSRLNDCNSATAIAVWANGELAEGFSYELAGTPCSDVTRDLSSCFFPSGVQELFPEDEDLVNMGVESYLGTPVRHPDGQVIGLLVVMDSKVMDDFPLRHHILEVFAARAGAEMVRRDAQEALRQSETHFRALMEQSPVATVIFSPDGILQTFNQACCTLWSIPREPLQSLVGQFNIHESSYFRDLGYGRKIEAAFAGESVAIPEHRLELCNLFKEIAVSSEPEEVWVKSRCYPLRDYQGRVSNVVLVFEDVSERRESDRQSRQLSERLSLALRAGAFGVWDWDVCDNVLVWDDFMYEIYGVSPEEFGGAYEAWEAGVHPHDMESSVANLNAALEGTKSFDTQFRIIRPDGQVRHVGAHAVVLRDADGKAVRMIGVNSDVTAQTEAQFEKEELQAQLNQAQRMESVGRLAGGVAHDFNNMLSVIIGNAELAMLGKNNDRTLLGELSEIRKAALRSAELTHQLLAFAREQTIAPVPLELNPVVESVFKMLERLVGAQITLLWQPEAQLWTVLADPAQMDQVLMNLCVNARDAIAGVGQVTMTTRNVTLTAEHLQSHPGSKTGEYVELSVRDDGCGMDEDTLGRAFEPFFTTKSKAKGTGLGLATVYGIVQQNGGHIDIESTPGEGTSVTILFPRYMGEKGDQQRRLPRTGGGCETVLLVEDQQQVLRVAKRMLENLGYRVFAATTPQQALDLVAELQEDIDLLLTDVIMPEMNGRELADQLLLHRPTLECLFMSGYTGDVIAEHGVLEEGMNFLSKPFSQSELASKVRETLDLALERR